MKDHTGTILALIHPDRPQCLAKKWGCSSKVIVVPAQLLFPFHKGKGYLYNAHVDLLRFTITPFDDQYLETIGLFTRDS